MNPQVDAKATRKMVKAIQESFTVKRSRPRGGRSQAHSAVQLVWSNSQCVHSRTGKCPLLIFGEQFAQRLKRFSRRTNENSRCR